MRPIENKKDRSRDHVMPRAFYLNPAFGADSKAINGDWNLQVMHKRCNEQRGGLIQGLPCFQCPCHYYRVSGKDLYVCYRTDQAVQSRLLMKDFVVPTDSGRPNGLAIRVEPVSDNRKSWPKDGRLVIDSSNKSIHYVVCINPLLVAQFNELEAQRIDTLVRRGSRTSRSQGPIPVVYLDPQHNMNFDFGPTRDARRANLSPFPSRAMTVSSNVEQ